MHRTAEETVEREDQIAQALESVGSTEAIALLRELSSQPRSIGDLAYRLHATRQEVWEAITPLCAAGVIELWGRDAWKMTLLGAEVWCAVEPLLVNKVV